MMNSKKTNHKLNTNNNNASVSFPSWIKVSEAGIFVEGLSLENWLQNISEETSKAWHLIADSYNDRSGAANERRVAARALIHSLYDDVCTVTSAVTTAMINARQYDPNSTIGYALKRLKVYAYVEWPALRDAE